MKTLIALILTAVSIIAYADEIETLTRSNEVYRASIKTNDVVFWNIIGKTSISRTNLTGWVNLKTNLLEQGYVLKSEQTKVYATPKALPDYAEFERVKYWADKANEPTVSYTPDPATPSEPVKNYESISYERNGAHVRDSIYRSPWGKTYKSRSVYYKDKNGNTRYDTYDIP